MKRPVLRALLTGAAMAIPLGAAQADDLRGALINAYQTNPDLQAARANQRATDENVPIARASALPSLQGNSTYTEFVKQTSNSFLAPSRVVSNDLQLSVPIFAGGAALGSPWEARLLAAGFRAGPKRLSLD